MFILSSAAIASCAVVMSAASLLTLAEYQNGFVGASGVGSSLRSTVRDNGETPSIIRRTRRNCDQPISSSALPLDISRTARSQREPNFVADSTAALKLMARDETSADNKAVPTT